MTANCRLLLQVASLLLICSLLGACSSLGYLTQVSVGHVGLLMQRQDIDKVISAEHTEPETRQKLQRVGDILDFAERELALPNNGSYSSYVALDREHVLWNVVAAREFSIEPETWCFPVTGCIAYRGYYEHALAQDFADELAQQGIETWIAPASAYSTLGWFKDPILSSMLQWSDAQFAALIFHELSHQVAYADNDTAFNEAFATAVARAGLRRWLAADRPQKENFEAHWRCQDQLNNQLQQTRAALAAIYATSNNNETKRVLKEQRFLNLSGNLQAWLENEPECGHFKTYVERPFNNARLVSIATYQKWVPAFERALQRLNGDIASLYQEVQALEKQNNHARLQWLQAQ